MAFFFVLSSKRLLLTICKVSSKFRYTISWLGKEVKELMTNRCIFILGGFSE
jgi:hypothetical protein